MIDSITFVVPSYSTASTLPELIDRIGALAPTFALRHSVVVVDDACPEGSGSLVADREHVSVYRFDANQGQRVAVLAGLGLVDSTLACVMDADLQDDPDTVLLLVAALDRNTADVVCAGRRGDHQSLRRRVEASMFRRARGLASRGRIPSDGGLFHVATVAAVRAMIEVARPEDDPLVAYARSGARIISVPVRRHRRADGKSSYTTRARVNMAVASLRGLSMPAGLTEPLPQPIRVHPRERS